MYIKANIMFFKEKMQHSLFFTVSFLLLFLYETLAEFFLNKGIIFTNWQWYFENSETKQIKVPFIMEFLNRSEMKLFFVCMHFSLL